MKKTLLAAAILGSFAASAFAAPSVTLYGVIDTGLNYTHYRAGDGTGSTDSWGVWGQARPRAPAGVFGGPKKSVPPKWDSTSNRASIRMTARGQ